MQARRESLEVSAAVAPIAPGLEVRRRQLETRELEARRHRAADERPGAKALGPLPSAGRHHRLWALTGEEVGPEPQLMAVSLVGNGQSQRRSCMPVPHLGG